MREDGSSHDLRQYLFGICGKPDRRRDSADADARVYVHSRVWQKLKEFSQEAGCERKPRTPSLILL